MKPGSGQIKPKGKASPRPFGWRAISYGVRLVLIACLLYASWSAVAAWSHLLGWLPFPSDVENNETVQPSSVAQIAPFPGQGGWGFPGLSGQVQTGEIPAAEVEAWLARELPPVTPSAEQSATEKDWLEVVKKSASPTAAQGPMTLYHLTQPLLKAVAFAQKRDGVERLLGARLAWPASKKAWQFLEIRLDGHLPEKQSRGNNLLPLPLDSSLLCRRLDGAGQVYCEVVTTQKSLGELTAFWRKQGWTVKEDATGQANTRGLICTRSSQVVIVWTANTPEPGQAQTILLLRGVLK